MDAFWESSSIATKVAIILAACVACGLFGYGYARLMAGLL